MNNYWNMLSEDLQYNILALRLKNYLVKFIKKRKKEKKYLEFLEYLEMKAHRENLIDPWWDYIDPIYGHQLIS